jgi:hypothetical protein
MNVRMNFEFLAPSVQHAEEANLCAEVSRIASDFEKGFGTGAEQEIVEDLLVLQNQWRQAAGECEDHVQIAGREQFSSTRGDPAFPCSDLTLRAVSVSAAIEGDGAMPAAGALIEMTTEGGGTTPANGQQHFDMLPTEPVAISFEESISRGADQIGHLEWWPGHLLFLRRMAFERQRIQWTRGRMQVTLGEMQIAGRLFQIVMT